MKTYRVNVVEKNPVPKSQTKPFYIGTKEAPSDLSYPIKLLHLRYTGGSDSVPTLLSFDLGKLQQKQKSHTHTYTHTHTHTHTIKRNKTLV